MTDLVKGRYTGPPFIASNCEILRQIISGVAHLHELKITHRDINPNNILISFPSGASDGKKKLANFGLSRIVPDNQKHLNRSKLRSGYSYRFGPCGTRGWMAPEMSKNEENYTDKIDIFSSGLVFGFTLCEGVHPFGDDDPQSSINKNMLVLTAEQLNGDHIAFELIQLMLSPELKERPSATEILKHDYFKAMLLNENMQPTSVAAVAASTQLPLSKTAEETITGILQNLEDFMNNGEHGNSFSAKRG